MRCLKLMLIAAALLAGPPGLHASGAAFPETVSLGGVRLVKVGEGAFRWMFIRVYDGVLYLDAERPQADPLSDVAKRLELSYGIGLSAGDFRRSGDEILARVTDPATLERLRPRLERLNAAYQPVEKGDRYALTYIPGEGTTLALNGEPLVTIEGEDFARAYFSIWLGPDPAKASFRRALLGS